MRRSFLSLVVVVASVLLVAPTHTSAQEESDVENEAAVNSEIDEFFQNAEADRTAPEAPAGTSSLDSFVSSKPLSFHGSLTSKVGLLTGLKAWPTSMPGDDDVDFSGYFDFENRLTCDARLDTSASFSATIYTEYPSFSMSMEEIFFDYSLADRLFFRVGKQKNAWGYARVFSDYDDLMESWLGSTMTDPEDGLTLKCYLPLGQGGLTAAVQDQKTWHPTSEYPGFDGLAYLAKGELVAGKLELQASGRYRTAEGGKAMLSAKTTMFGVDLFHESMVAFNASGDRTYSAFAGFYWEHSEPSVTIYGEYAYLGFWGNAADHRLCLAALLKTGSLFGKPVKIGAKWVHAFADESGTVLPVIAVEPASRLSISFGIPMLYGDDDSIYVLDSDDSAKRRISVALIGTVTLKY